MSISGMEFDFDETKQVMIDEMKIALNSDKTMSDKAMPQFDIDVAHDSSVVVSFQKQALGYQRDHLLMPEFKMSDFDQYETEMRAEAIDYDEPSNELLNLYYDFGKNIWLQATTLFLKTDYDHVLDIMSNVSYFDNFSYGKRSDCSVKEIANEYLVGVLQSNELEKDSPLNKLLSYENNNDHTKKIKVGLDFNSSNFGIKDFSLTVLYFDKNNDKHSCAYQGETIMVQPDETFDSEIFIATINEQAQIFLDSPEFKNIKALSNNQKPTI